MTLENEEFLRQFSQHILPWRFTKIRHCDFHSGAPHLQIDTLTVEFRVEIFPKAANIPNGKYPIKVTLINIA